MALFSSKSKKAAAETKEPKKVAPRKAAIKSVKKTETVSEKSQAILGLKDVIIRPRVTEKAANLTTANVYTFDIRANATKLDVVAAVKALYKVTPIKVNVVNVIGKRVSLRRRRGFGKTASSRKAYVYLKKGEEIRFS